ncbi:hypothetical protein ACFQ36_19275 [Arthrobacter sp. GCM10027362]|uniref:hypothetical protein n=1 Tax=Arthrobacter sp. GCM10027362 TaxID=3273379 RepID=UPI00362B104E
MEEASRKLYNYRGLDGEVQDLANYFSSFPADSSALRFGFAKAARAEFTDGTGIP